jgi:hypothetical protein
LTLPSAGETSGAAEAPLRLALAHPLLERGTLFGRHPREAFFHATPAFFRIHAAAPTAVAAVLSARVALRSRL